MRKSRELQLAEDGLKDAARAYVEAVHGCFSSPIDDAAIMKAIANMGSHWKNLKIASQAYAKFAKCEDASCELCKTGEPCH